MEEREQKQQGGEAAHGEGEEQSADRERVIRETREAGMRAEGGGSADEAEIRAAAEKPEG